MVSTPSANATVQLQTLSLFYSVQLHHDFSLSVSSGPEKSRITLPQVPSSSSWAPNIRANAAWENNHAGVSIGYVQAVTSGGGLLGEYSSNSANAGLHWHPQRDWTIQSAASYFVNKNVISQLSSLNPGGQSLIGTVSIGHLISQHIQVELGYSRLHERFADVGAISGAPDSDRGFISIAYQFTKALGR